MKKKNDLTKNKILEHGKKLLLANKLSDFNMREIAICCDIALGTIYNYFENKEQLAREIINNDWHICSVLFENAIRTNADLKTKLSNIYEIMKNFISCYFDIYYEVILNDSKGCPDVFRDDMSQLLLKLIKDERKLGNITNHINDEKLVQFIMMSFFYNLKNQLLSFDELISCIKFN